MNNVNLGQGTWITALFLFLYLFALSLGAWTGALVLCDWTGVCS